MTEHAVLIAAGELLPALKSRLSAEAQELLAFTDGEALRALELITTRRPALVLLERSFASTPRGAALINRIKADPSLVETQLRLVGADGTIDSEPVLATAAATVPAPKARSHPKRPVPSSAPSVQVQPEPELDFRGTRRATRFRIVAGTEVLVDGNRATLIDLSTLGAQLVTTTVLKPNQRVRLSLPDDERPIRCTATVVWASFEIPKGASARYRAGLDFIEPDGGGIDAYIRRHHS